MNANANVKQGLNKKVKSMKKRKKMSFFDKLTIGLTLTLGIWVVFSWLNIMSTNIDEKTSGNLATWNMFNIVKNI